MAAALYVAGACSGALVFGRLTDLFGRKRLFLITLGVYLAATALTAISFSSWWFFVFRFLTGFGIGGEYAAINSAIDELIPSKYRGRVDLVINGTFWLGAIAGALLSVLALDTGLFPVWLGWRLTFALGVVLGLVILLVRRHVPESPRWMFIHGKATEAEELVTEVERRVEEEKGEPLPEPGEAITVTQRRSTGFGEIARTVFRSYPAGPPSDCRSSSARPSCTTRSPSGSAASWSSSSTSRRAAPATTSPSSPSATSSDPCSWDGSSTPSDAAR